MEGKPGKTPEKEQQLIEEIQNKRRELVHLINNVDLQYPGTSQIPQMELQLLMDLRSMETHDMAASTEPSTLIGNFEQEIECSKVDLHSMVHNHARVLDDIGRLEKDNEQMNKIIGSASPKNILQNIGTIESNVLRRFKMEKNRLKEVLSAILPGDEDTTNLVATVVRHYFTNGPESYFEMEAREGQIERVKFLVRSRLFETDSTNPLLIRMVDLS